MFLFCILLASRARKKLSTKHAVNARNRLGRALAGRNIRERRPIEAAGEIAGDAKGDVPLRLRMPHRLGYVSIKLVL
jgi:hypothetical protein